MLSFHHQQQLVNRVANLKRSQRGILAMHPTGSGKTVSGIVTLANFPHLQWIIVAPVVGILDQWKQSMVDVLKTAPGEIQKQSQRTLYMTYQDLLTQQTLLPTEAIVMCDEAHRLLDFDGSIYGKELQAVYTYLQKSVRRIVLLTASPFKHSLSDTLTLVELVRGSDIITNDEETRRLRTEKPWWRRAVIGWGLPLFHTYGMGVFFSLRDFMALMGMVKGVPREKAMIRNILIQSLYNLVYTQFFKKIVDDHVDEMRELDPKKVAPLIAPYVDVVRPESIGFPKYYVKKEEYRLDFETMVLLTKIQMGFDTLQDFVDIGLTETPVEGKILYKINTLEDYLNLGSLMCTFSGRGKTSAKCLKLLEVLSKHEHRRVTIYSRFDRGGQEVFRVLTKHVYGGDETRATSRVYRSRVGTGIPRDVFETHDILLLDPKHFEGIDIIGCLAFIFMEPPVDMVMAHQALGRPVRMVSHIHLPESMRHVHFYFLIGKFPEVNATSSGVKQTVMNILQSFLGGKNPVIAKLWFERHGTDFAFSALKKKIDVIESPEEMAYNFTVRQLERFKRMVETVIERYDLDSAETDTLVNQCNIWFPTEVLKTSGLPDCPSLTSYYSDSHQNQQRKRLRKKISVM